MYVYINPRCQDFLKNANDTTNVNAEKLPNSRMKVKSVVCTLGVQPLGRSEAQPRVPRCLI